MRGGGGLKGTFSNEVSEGDKPCALKELEREEDDDFDLATATPHPVT